MTPGRNRNNRVDDDLMLVMLIVVFQNHGTSSCLGLHCRCLTLYSIRIGALLKMASQAKPSLEGRVIIERNFTWVQCLGGEEKRVHFSSLCGAAAALVEQGGISLCVRTG